MIIGIFTNPESVFNQIKLNPNWILPLLIMVAVSIGFLFTTPELQIKAEKEAIYNNTLIPEEMKDRAIEELENKSPTRRTIETVFKGALGVPIVYLIAALAFFAFGNFFYGGSASFT